MPTDGCNPDARRSGADLGAHGSGPNEIRLLCDGPTLAFAGAMAKNTLRLLPVRTSVLALAVCAALALYPARVLAVPGTSGPATARSDAGRRPLFATLRTLLLNRFRSRSVHPPKVEPTTLNGSPRSPEAEFVDVLTAVVRRARAGGHGARATVEMAVDGARWLPAQV